MTLDQFEKELKGEVENFIISWREENSLTPDEFPMEMSAGDWWEQFIVRYT